MTRFLNRLVRPGRRLAALALVGMAMATTASADERALPDIERLVSLPTLSGTPPSNPTWSPDGRHVAFLWNDSGLLFRDLWIVDADGGEARRLTEFDPSAADHKPFGEHIGDDTSLSALREASARRHRGGLSQFIWTPEGDRIVFPWDGEIHTVSIDGGTPEKLVDTGGGASRLAYSPDGRYLSFLQGGDLWLYRFDGEYLTQATHIGEPGIGTVPVGAFNALDREYSNYSWSPDGRYIALDYNDRRDVHRMQIPSYLHEEPIMHEVRRSYPGDEGLIRKVGIYDTADGMVRYLDLEEPLRRTILNMEWSPVAPELMVHQDTYDGEHRWIFVANPADRSVRQVVHDHRPNRIYAMFNATWSSDGRRIYYVGDTDDWYRLYSVPAAGGRSQILTRGDFDLSGAGFGRAMVEVSPETREIFYVSTEESPYERHVYRMRESGGSATRVTSMPGMHEQAAVSPDGRRIAVVSSNDVTPHELYLIDARNGDQRRITHSPLPGFEDIELVEPKYVTFPSRIDDFTLHARIIEPPNMDPDKQYPVIIGNVYSATARNQWVWPRPISLLQQKMTVEDEYITVQVDLRGSAGYGVDFREAFQGDWGGGDLEDLHSTVDYLTSLPYVDPERIGIWGNSYGGMMVLFALFERPGMFAAGISGSPAIDVHYFTQNDQHLSRRPQTHPEIFDKSTLLNYGEKLEDPLLFIHGFHDDIVPLKTTIDMFEKLMLLGKDFDMIIPPESAHWWAYPEHYAVHTFRKFMQFFHRHVRPGGKPRDGEDDR